MRRSQWFLDVVCEHASPPKNTRTTRTDVDLVVAALGQVDHGACCYSRRCSNEGQGEPRERGARKKNARARVGRCLSCSHSLGSRHCESPQQRTHVLCDLALNRVVAPPRALAVFKKTKKRAWRPPFTNAFAQHLTHAHITHDWIHFITLRIAALGRAHTEENAMKSNASASKAGATGEAPQVVLAFCAAFAVGLLAFTSTHTLALHRTINLHLPGCAPSLPGVFAEECWLRASVQPNRMRLVCQH